MNNQRVSFCERTVIDSQEAPGRLNRPTGEVPERPHSSHPLILSTSSPHPDVAVCYSGDRGNWPRWQRYQAHHRDRARGLALRQEAWGDMGIREL